MASQQEIPSFIPNYLAIPNEDDMDIMFFGSVVTNNPLLSQYGSMVVYDHHTGELKTKYDIRHAGVLQKFDDSTRKLHFGYFAGIWSKIIWSIVGLAPVILMVTGTLMFIIRRQPKTRLNRRKKTLPAHSLKHYN
ncbi:PepSY-associated TM helix domain-containing protein [Opacimonas viscosa]|nr:PepSY-associated TM helix domain-containing protein [Opacimonas viscosa]